MTDRSLLLVATAALVAAAACASASGGQTSAPPASEPGPIVGGYTQADVDFMTNMIHHHAQALVMAEMVLTHGAGERLLLLAERVHVSQTDEIALMGQWLRARGLPVPDPVAAASPTHHTMNMPGMLTAQQMAELDRARGPEFDRLFLTFMIHHHEGALIMVEELFRAPGAGQGNDIFRFASDVNADQLAEIERMEQLLATMNQRGN